MKTILVIYSDSKVSKGTAHSFQKYAFNSKDNFKVGDTIESPNYSTRMQVVKVLNKEYKYYNKATGKLSNTFNSTKQWEIRELILRDSSDNVVYGKLIKD